jgi:polar amino acid transport system permease protein
MDSSPRIPARPRNTFPVAEAAIGAIAIALLAPLVWTFARSPELEWGIAWDFLFSELILTGLWITVVLSVVPMIVGLLLGAVVALFTVSGLRVLRVLGTTYVWIFRAVPLLVQLIFWFNLGLVIPTVTFGIPGTAIASTYVTNNLISGLTAALLGLTLHETAVIAEIYRGGILGVSHGQLEAGQAMGLTKGAAIRRIVFPQAIRSVVPALGNVFIGLIKATALVSVIGAGDLLTNAQRIYASNFQVIPLLIVVTIWYLALTAIFTLAQMWLERWMDNRGSRRVSVSHPAQHVRAEA